MDHFEPLKELHRDREVFAKEYFSQLNRVRVNIKHHGLFPDTKQWARVGETVYGYISKWCSDYLEISLEGLDESSLLKNPEVKARFDLARDAISQGEYRRALEELGIALFALFADSTALRGLAVGVPKTEDAIREAAFTHGEMMSDWTRPSWTARAIMLQWSAARSTDQGGPVHARVRGPIGPTYAGSQGRRNI